MRASAPGLEVGWGGSLSGCTKENLTFPVLLEKSIHYANGNAFPCAWGRRNAFPKDAKPLARARPVRARLGILRPVTLSVSCVCV